MAMRYIRLWGIGAMHKTRLFKWEWRVLYDLNQIGQWITYDSGPLANRSEVRRFRSLVPVIARNVKTQRRLVQAHWDDV